MSQKKDKVSIVFWTSVSVVFLSFGMAIYTAITHPEQKGPELVKPGQGQSIPLPVTPDSP